MLFLLTFIIPFFAAFLGIVFYSGSLPSPVFQFVASYNQYPISRHCTSWNTWLHPSDAISEGNGVMRRKGWNIHHHLGGNGPWIEMIDDEEFNSREIRPPNGCTVDQIHMIARHAERYPTTSAGDRHLVLMKRIEELNVLLNGSLSFLNNWTYITNDPSKDFNQLTSTGPYAGTLQAFTTGVRFRTRYGHLLQNNIKTRLWASDSNRVIQTAKYFSSGLFGLDWEKDGTAVLQVIPETFEQRADTLTPGDTCLNYLEDNLQGHGLGENMLARIQEAYIPPLAKRLVQEEHNGDLRMLTLAEVYSMQEMCGFETTVRGSSPWCDVFTNEEWEDFAYARDVLHYYRAGPGNPYAGAMGWLWLNATTSLLRSGPDHGSMFFSFVHDGDIAPFLTALDILKDTNYDPTLPTTHVAKNRVWRTSSVLPMGARITMERMTCPSLYLGQDDVFVRININDRIKPLPYCKSGPGASCSLSEFVSHVRRRGMEVGEFGQVCGLEGDVGRITFLHQENINDV